MASVIEIPEKSAVLAQDFEMLINGELTRGGKRGNLSEL